MLQPHQIVDRGDCGHCEPRREDIGRSVEQVDIVQIDQAWHEPHRAGPIRRRRDLQTGDIGIAAKWLGSGGVGKERKFQVRSLRGQVGGQRQNHLANAARPPVQITAIDQNSRHLFWLKTTVGARPTVPCIGQTACRIHLQKQKMAPYSSACPV